MNMFSKNVYPTAKRKLGLERKTEPGLTNNLSWDSEQDHQFYIFVREEPD